MIVVGGGPVGLTTALTLAGHGVPVTVIEAEAGIVFSPRALVYHPPTLEALGQLGLMEDLTAAGVLKQQLLFKDGQGRDLAQIDYRHLEGRTPYPYNLHLGQDVLAGIVLQHLERLPGTQVLWNHRLTAIEQDADSITAIAAGPAGEVRLAGRWLVGADGASSGTRQALGLGFEGKTWPDRFVATNVVYDFEADGYARATFVIDADHWAIIVKINEDNLWRCTYGESAELPPEGIRDRVPENYAHFMRRMTRADGSPNYEIRAVSPYRVHERAADSFRAGRALLAGDAAHICNPCGGFGLTSGLLDAVALGHPLAAVFLGRQDEAILDRYAEERKRIFLEKTSPAASDNLRRFRERDPAKKAEDMARFRRLREEPEFNATVGSYSFNLASPELADPKLVTG